jgi:hypothetical protein
MSSITHLQSAVESLLNECLSELPRASRQRLSFFVVGVLLASAVLQAPASMLSKRFAVARVV